jgi:hypothetical protein
LSVVRGDVRGDGDVGAAAVAMFAAMATQTHRVGAILVIARNDGGDSHANGGGDVGPWWQWQCQRRWRCGAVVVAMAMPAAVAM